MASSQVEIAASSSFGYVLKDRNRHDHHRFRTGESNAFQKNFKDLVQTHLNSCISGHSRNSGSISSNKIDYTDLWVHNPQSTTNENYHHLRNLDGSRISDHSDSNENSQHHIDHTNLWVHNPKRNNNENISKKTRAGEKWDKARDIVFVFERKFQDGGSSSGPVSTSQRERSPDSPTSGPVSMTSQREMNHDIISPCPIPLFQRVKSERIASETDFRYQRENSPVKSEGSMEVQSLGGVSSLVRKWKDFEAESRCFSAANSPLYCSRNTSTLFFADNSSFADAPLQGSDACEEFADLRPTTPSKSDDLFLDWESEQAGLSGPPSSRGRDSDVTESERIRVADIIRKWTSNVEGHNGTVSHESLPRVRTSVDKSEHRVFSPVSSSPRIRGRQAFTDLLMQMERDRHRELERLNDSKVVSRFSHRGRIQTMLRVRFLRCGAEEKDNRYCNPIPTHSNRLTPSAIVHIREKFNEGVKQCGTHLRCEQGEAEDKISKEEKAHMICRQRKDIHKQEFTKPTKSPKVEVDNIVAAKEPNRVIPVVGINHHESNTMVHQETNSRSDLTLERTSFESRNRGNTESILAEISLKLDERNKNSQLEESNNNQNLAQNSNGFMDTWSKLRGDWEAEENTHQHLVVSDCNEESDVSQPSNEWEEFQDNYQQQVEMNQDWITDVSRPRSTWEDLRQERYQEMLDPFMQNDDIRQLLQRKSVSNFLSSGLRESIDRLMMARVQSQPIQLIKEEHKSHKAEEEIPENVKIQEEEQKRPEESDHHNNDFEEDEEADVIQIGEEYNESHDSWDDTRKENEVSDNYYDPSASPFPRRSLSSSSSSPETHPSSSFTDHPSIEMQFIYELRGNMEQLHQEISKLRRSVKSCINMQMKLQESLTKSTTMDSCHSGRKKRKDSSLGKKSSRGRCCICYEMQIDSLLYRCGHMCTCFKCASDLQWGSGKCPICQAPIMDVVRAYAYS